ncbi:MAG: response regulator [Bacteroidota bacterium]
MSTEILIVEDEPIIADDLAMTLEKMNYNVVDIFDNAEDTLNFLKKSKPDLLLLDINIEGDRDGIELGTVVGKEYKLPFIFLTSYYDKSTVDRASKANPLGYLVKPFNERDLQVNIELAIKKSKSTVEPVSENFFVRQNNELISLNQGDIVYAEAYDNYAYIHTAEKKYLVSHTLKSIEQKLDPNRFSRVHKSYLIQFSKITSISEGYLYLGTVQLPIGKVYKQALFNNLSIL